MHGRRRFGAGPDVGKQVEIDVCARIAAREARPVFGRADSEPAGEGAPHLLGRGEAGHPGDLVLLDADPLDGGSDREHAARLRTFADQVVATWVAGEAAYEREV